MQEKRQKYNGVYYELHHIFPKSIYPKYKNLKRNTVLLTAKEHFICHHLLTKFTVGNAKRKMIHAFWGLCNQKSNNRLYKITSRVYETCKILKARESSRMHKNKIVSKETAMKISKSNTGKKRSKQFKENRRKAMLGKSNPNFNKPGTWTDKKHTAEELEKMSLAQKGENNYQFKGYYHTPSGKFPSISGKIAFGFANPGTLRRWCKNSERVISQTAYEQNDYLFSLGEGVVGKTFEELGFWFESI